MLNLTALDNELQASDDFAVVNENPESGMIVVRKTKEADFEVVIYKNGDICVSNLHDNCVDADGDCTIKRDERDWLFELIKIMKNYED